MCEHCKHLQLTRIEKKLDLLLNLEGYEIDEYGLPTPSQGLLEEQQQEEEQENEDEETEEKGAKIYKTKRPDEDE